MNITIDSSFDAFVTDEATKANITAEQYVERKANGAVRGAVKSALIAAINSAKPEEVAQYATAVFAVKDEIQAEAEAAKAKAVEEAKKQPEVTEPPPVA